MLSCRTNSTRSRMSCAVAPLLLASSAFSQGVTIDTVAVGDAGNDGWSTYGHGAVGYQYSIGRYEVTNSQYAAFLNARATTADPYGLFNLNMAGSSGGITFSGGPPTGFIPGSPRTYVAKSGRENSPVNFVSFWDAARFTNWLQNGQGNGDTETGTYTLTSGAISANTVTRNPGSTWAITSGDEWFKAAYYKGGGLSAGYWDFPTQSDSMTTAMANFGGSVGTVTPVGSYALTSAYGAFDMGGNVAEWTETISGSSRLSRGGSFDDVLGQLRLTGAGSALPATESSELGFRVSLIPGPGPLAALALGGVLIRRRRR